MAWNEKTTALSEKYGGTNWQYKVQRPAYFQKITVKSQWLCVPKNCAGADTHISPNVCLYKLFVILSTHYHRISGKVVSFVWQASPL